MVHNMQLRVAGLIERCQDEIILESTLVINDELNSLFVRYDRWLKNSAAAKAKPGPEAVGETTGPPPTYQAEPTADTTGVSLSVRI